MIKPNHFEEVLREARAGNKQAMGQALEGCYHYLLTIGYLHIPESLRAKGGPSDIVQVTCLEAIRALPTFEGTNEREFAAWLCKILVRNASNFRNHHYRDKRDARREVTLDRERADGGLARLPGAAPDPVKEVVREEEVAPLRRALQELPEHYRQVIRLHNEDRHTFQEIGAMLGCTAGAAKKVWQRALRLLRKLMEG